MIAIIIFLAVIGILVIWFIGAYNGLVRLRNQVKNAWHQIDVQLKRRYDLIPNLVEVVKDYMSYEQETLEKVIKARNVAINAQGAKKQAEAENMLSGTLKSLFAVVERYPELKANQNVQSLQEELTATENKISFARQFYNDIVYKYNTRTEVIPTNIIAGMFNFKPEEFFEVEEEGREPVKVDLR
jgi:LemA protein